MSETTNFKLGCSGIIHSRDLKSLFTVERKGTFALSLAGGQSWLSIADPLFAELSVKRDAHSLTIIFSYRDGDTGYVKLDLGGVISVCLPIFHKFSLYYLIVDDKLYFGSSLYEVLKILPREKVASFSCSIINIQNSDGSEDIQPLPALVYPIQILVQNVIFNWNEKGTQVAQRQSIRHILKKYIEQRVPASSTSEEWFQFFQSELIRILPETDIPIGVTLSGGQDSPVIALAALSVYKKVVLLIAKTPQNAAIIARRVATIQQFYPSTEFIIEEATIERTLFNPAHLQDNSPYPPEGGQFQPIFRSLAARAAAAGVHTVLLGVGAEDVVGHVVTMKAEDRSRSTLDKQSVKTGSHKSSTFFSNVTGLSLSSSQLSFNDTGIRTVSPLLTSNCYFSLLTLPKHLRQQKRLFVEILKASILNEQDSTPDDFGELSREGIKGYSQFWKELGFNQELQFDLQADARTLAEAAGTLCRFKYLSNYLNRFKFL